MKRLALRPLAAIAVVAAMLAAAAPANAEVDRTAANLFPYPGSDITLVNHRGLSPEFPENTLAAFRNSIAMGVDVIEIDMRTTKDGEIVILHDATVDRTTDGTGPVSALTLAQVKELDAGGYVGPQFVGERIPTFEEALRVVQGTGVKLLLDIKTASVTEEAVKLVEQYGMIDDVIVGPRTVDNLTSFKALNPDLTTLGFIATEADADAMIDAGVDYIRLWPEWLIASRDSAECKADYAARVAAFERGERDHPGSAACNLQRVVSRGTPVWSTVNDLSYEGMDEIIKLGATGVLSDLPAELDRLLGDIDTKRLAAARSQVGALSRTLADDYSPRSLLRRQAALLVDLIRHPRQAKSIHEQITQLNRVFAAVAKARGQLDRATAYLRAGKTDKACSTLGRVVSILGDSHADPNYAWSAREARRILAC